MRRRQITGQHSSIEGINATPLIDVVMCLIVFFLIVGKLAADRGAAVVLPESRTGLEESSAAVMIVTVSRPSTELGPRPGAAPTGWAALGLLVQADGQETADARALETAVRSKLAQIPDAAIQLRADRDLPFGSIEPVLRACGNAGAKGVRLATEKTP